MWMRRSKLGRATRDWPAELPSRRRSCHRIADTIETRCGIASTRRPISGRAVRWVIRGRISASIEEIVESRATYRQPCSGRKLIVHSPQHRVHTSREVHVNVEGRVWTVVGEGVWLMRVSITAEEM